MHVDHQRLAAHLLGVDAGRVGEPVVGVDNIEGFLACNHTGHNRVVVDFLEQVLGVAAREIDTAKVVGVEAAEVGIDAVAQVVILLGIHAVAVAFLHIVPVHVLPYHGRIGSSDDMHEVFFLVALRFRQDEGHITFASIDHTAHNTVRSRSQTAQDMRRPFPAKH